MVRKKISIVDLNVWYGVTQALKSIKLDVYENEILSIIGPSNSGKTTFLRCLNRLIDLDDGVRVSGKIYLDNFNIFEEKNPETVRRKIGMIFALPTPLPLTIYDNVAYGPRRNGIKNKEKLDEIVEESLKKAYLWKEVSDRLSQPAMLLSGGQQQRLCIARSLAVEPQVLLLDEPCSGLDPISTAAVEEAMSNLKTDYTFILVTNNTKQAARVGDRTAFFLMGELVEIDETAKIFTAPKDERTNGYVSGRFG